MNARYSLLGLRDALRGEEPAPAEFLTNRSYYPWLVVGTVCIGAFIGQFDASIVQLALPALEREFDARLHIVSWVAVSGMFWLLRPFCRCLHALPKSWSVS